MAQPSAPERPIDRALTLVANSNPEAALRYALPLIEQEPKDALSSFVAGRALADLGDTALAETALSLAVRRAISSNNLPLAVAAAATLRTAGKDNAKLLAEIGAAFGRGSSLLGERRAAPPELPGTASEFDALSDDLAGKDLLARASTVIEEAASRSAVEPGKRSLSPQALFSSLAPHDLAEFAAIFDVRVLPSGARVVEEGTLGSEAFVLARGELDVEKRSEREEGATLHLARLGAGALVGEMALLSRSPRAATVTAIRPSVILVGAKDALDQAAQRSPVIAERFAEHCKRRMLDNLVRASPLFRAATPAERPSLVERFGIRTFEPGEKLATQGQPSEGLFLLASGEVTIVHREGDERTLVTKLGVGDVVGEVALILRRPAIADAVAQHPTITLFLPGERFLDLVHAHPKVFADLYAIAVKRDQEIASIAGEEATEGEDFVLV
ncbi:MAG TPA: cyclic nucleotide-binding domain-containing protein [Polyangiaceae bacterium]|nr:cyclic nucleotide-binding domain-containing protein [Polyangiaceae bacterium]